MASEEPESEIVKGVMVTTLGVKVWSTIGIKVPVPGLDFTMVEFSFGHERYAKSSTQEDIANAARLVEEFNTVHLDKQLRKILRDIRRIDGEVSADTKIPSVKKKKGKKKTVTPQTVQQRARARLGKS